MTMQLRPIVETLMRYNLLVHDSEQDVGTVEVVADDEGILIQVRLDDDVYGVRFNVRMS